MAVFYDFDCEYVTLKNPTWCEWYGDGGDDALPVIKFMREFNSVKDWGRTLDGPEWYGLDFFNLERRISILAPKVSDTAGEGNTG